MRLTEEEMNKGIKKFVYFCYDELLNNEFKQKGIKPITESLTLDGVRYHLYWKSKKVKTILSNK